MDYGRKWMERWLSRDMGNGWRGGAWGALCLSAYGIDSQFHARVLAYSRRAYQHPLGTFLGRLRGGRRATNASGQT
jgi:hypothetical protein